MPAVAMRTNLYAYYKHIVTDGVMHTLGVGVQDMPSTVPEFARKDEPMHSASFSARALLASARPSLPLCTAPKCLGR